MYVSSPPTQYADSSAARRAAPSMPGSASTTSAERVLACQGLADDELVDLGRALVGQHRLEFVGVPHDRVLAADAVGGQDGAALPGDRDGLTRVVQLADTDLLGAQRPLLLQPAEMDRQQDALVQ